MLSENEEPLALGGVKPPLGGKKAGKLGMAADASDDEDLFADICVDDLDEAQAEAAVLSPAKAPDGGEEPEPAAPAASHSAGADEEQGVQDTTAQEEAAAAALSSRPPLHPGKPTAAAAQQVALPQVADLAGEGGQDSCSVCSELSGSDQHEGRSCEQEGEQAPQAQQPGTNTDEGDSASLSDDPAHAALQAASSEAACSPSAEALAPAAASPAPTSSPSKSAAQLVSSGSAQAAGGPAEPNAVHQPEPEPAAQLEIRLDSVAVAQETEAPGQQAAPEVQESSQLQQEQEQQPMEEELPAAVPRPEVPSTALYKAAVDSAVLVQAVSQQPAAVVASEPAIPQSVLQPIPQPVQPKQQTAAVAAAVPKPAALAALPAKPTAPVLAVAPPAKPTAPVLAAAAPVKPAAMLLAKPAAPVQPVRAPAALAGLTLKPAAPTAVVGKPAPAAVKFSLSGSNAASGTAASSLNLLLPKAGAALGSCSTFKSPSRLGGQPAGNSMPAAKPGAGLPAAAAPQPAWAGAATAVPVKQQQPAPAQRLHPLAPVHQQPPAQAAGTPISALPKHMQMAPAAGTKVSTLAPFTPGNGPSTAVPAPPKQEQPAQPPPVIPPPATLADDILAADFGPSAVLAGHDACMEESLALCAPIGDAVQEQMLALDQLGLEAEALRRQVNALRVDVTIYRSSLAFMDNPLQAHSFEAAKRNAAELWDGLSGYQPPSFEMPPPPAPAPPPEPEQLPAYSGGKTVMSAEMEQGGAGGEESLIKPRALEAAFNEQPFSDNTSSCFEEPAAARVGTAVPPTQETGMGTAAPAVAAGTAVMAVPPTQETGMGTAAPAVATGTAVMAVPPTQEMGRASAAPTVAAEAAVPLAAEGLAPAATVAAAEAAVPMEVEGLGPAAATAAAEASAPMEAEGVAPAGPTAAAEAAAPMEAEGLAVSLVLSARGDEVVLSLAV